MLTVIILCALASLAAGFLAKFVIGTKGDYADITSLEMVVGFVICSLVVIPLITWGGFSIVRHSNISYNEFRSGLEKTATEKVTTCRRDGSCKHEYNCDPYITTYTTTDSKGNVTVHTQTNYHRCPYTDTEHTFTVTDTLGKSYTIGDHWFPAQPSLHRWRNKGFPAGIPKGIPTQWAEAKTRIDSGNPGGTTARFKYDNFIQASQDDIYAKYSDSIESYQKQGILPKVTKKVYNHYMADKVYFPTGVPTGTSAADWQEALSRLDGKIGGDKHGDLHLVLVDSGRINNVDQYTASLDAYWQSRALGKNTLSKNGIVVVVGISGGAVTNARAFTGMPLGNETFTVAVRENLTGTTATPLVVINKLGSLIFAPGDSGYNRVSMTDYRYLFDSIQPSGWSKFWIAFIAFLLSLGVWFTMTTVDLYLPVSFRKYFTKE